MTTKEFHLVFDEAFSQGVTQGLFPDEGIGQGNKYRTKEDFEAALRLDNTISDDDINEKKAPPVTRDYRMMIYFATATLHFYSADLISNEKMSVVEFYGQNQSTCKRVFEEGLSIMNYEISSEQMNKACYAYLQSKYYPSAIKNNKTFSN